jgi:hypothetical protein
MRFFSFILLAFLACNSSKTKAERAAEKDKAMYLVVSFISKGSGVDGQAFTDMKNIMGKFKDCEVSCSVVPWGREGEKDFCMQATDEKCFKHLEKKVIEKFKNNELVQIKKGDVCRKK